MTDKKNTEKDQPAASESGKPFTDGLDKELTKQEKDGLLKVDDQPNANDARIGRLKDAIKEHALANRKVVRARRAR
jgi:hypothetical protein